MQKKIKNIIKKKISVNLKLTESSKKLTKKQTVFCKKIQNNAEYNMFEDDQKFYKHVESESENFNNISKNKNTDFMKLFK